ncbi:hypothetical protein TTHERM_00046290 (macronuclear) [Tetrahymena thermophila SB210]|uniref:Uncharacterized protein n=1 Tax=Tetrahymena thermophila (strain SB210) TaxID=312017 RepID=Q23DR2_TETTS|nr:hypothetical protein TTHERM_00046290 [Tetrahymena thermophila SB210]EAR94323.1 hypothetical protein TTHERM_00046290 [Tetrahymena thermophila SB210]|eukprot:XP_001014624.1 hypothetical protein TTHERM_00046290 [Tetrahymena thermophila SB210]
MNTIQKIFDLLKKLDLPYCSESDHFDSPLTDIGLYNSGNYTQQLRSSQQLNLRKNEIQSMESELIHQNGCLLQQDIQLQLLCPICRYNIEDNQQSQQRPFDIIPIKMFLKNIIQSLNNKIENRQKQSDKFIESIKLQLKDVKIIRKMCHIIEQKLQGVLQSYESVIQMREKSELSIEKLICQMLEKQTKEQSFQSLIFSLQEQCAIQVDSISSTYQITIKTEQNQNKLLFNQYISKMLECSTQIVDEIKKSLQQNIHEFDQSESISQLFDQIKKENDELHSNFQINQSCSEKNNFSTSSMKQSEISTQSKYHFKEELNKFEILNKQTENFLLNINQTKNQTQNQFQTLEDKFPKIIITHN